MTHFAILCTGGSRLGTVASGWLDLTTVVTNLGLGRAAAGVRSHLACPYQPQSLSSNDELCCSPAGLVGSAA